MLAKEFMRIFSGNERAHGIFNMAEENANGKRVGVYKIMAPPAESYGETFKR